MAELSKRSFKHEPSSAPIAPNRQKLIDTVMQLLPSCSVAELYEHALKHEPSTHIVSSGALATLSGAKTGRSPK